MISLLCTWNSNHVLLGKGERGVEVFLIEAQDPGPNVCCQLRLIVGPNPRPDTKQNSFVS
jgi:hypothetical protein